MIQKKLICVVCLFSLSACESLPERFTDSSDVKASIESSVQDAALAGLPPKLEIPDAIEMALTTELGSAGEAGIQTNEKRFDINARDVEATTFFTSLVKGSPLSVAIHPDVSGTISLQLKQVTLPETIDLVSDMYGYDIQRTGQVLNIYPAGLRVEIIPMNYLFMERYGSSSLSVSSGGVSESDSDDSSSSTGTQVETSSSTDMWSELETTLLDLIGAETNDSTSHSSEESDDESSSTVLASSLASNSSSDGRSVSISPQAGLVTVRAYPDDIRVIKEYLSLAEVHLKRQVILEAKIIEVELSEAYQQGIDWNSDFSSTASTLTNDIVSSIGGGGSFTLGAGSFEMVINLLSTQGDVNVLSSPRVTASNNQKAVIKVGSDEYFVTDITLSTDDDDDSVSMDDIELTAFFSGIALDVTPQINDENEVLLHIHPSVIDVEEQSKTISFGSGSSADTITLPLAYSDTREADTIIKARSGEVVVIGGLMKTAHEEMVAKMPFLGDIPILGELFTNRSVATSKTELIILLKPIVVERNTWRRQIERSQELLDEWYPEGI